MDAIVHDTLRFARSFDTRLANIWAAFADSNQRASWSVPPGEALVHDEANFHASGRDMYRCGPPETLEFRGVLHYVQIVPESVIVHTDTVTHKEQVIAVALLTWEFEDHGDTTVVRLTDQVTSFVGNGDDRWP